MFNEYGSLPELSLLEDPHRVQALGLLHRRDAVLLLLQLDHGKPLLAGPLGTCHAPGQGPLGE